MSRHHDLFLLTATQGEAPIMRMIRVIRSLKYRDDLQGDLSL